MAQVVLLSTVVLACLACLQFTQGAFSSSNDRVLLRDISVLTLYHGKHTTARRSSPIPQLKCTGGTASCSAFVPKVVQCYNRGSDGYDVQWECKTDMDNAYRFGEIEVSCEGYDYPDDPFVLRGSCGMEYSLDLTKEGHQQQKYKSQHNYYQDDTSHNSHSSYQQKLQKGGSWIGDLITLTIIGIVIFALYRTCIAPSYTDSSDDSDTQGRHRSSRPPPPGFRSDYMPGGDDGPSCSSQSRTYNSSYNTGTQGSRAGGFWTGAATGGLLGYLLGSRTGTGYQQPYTRPYSPWGSGYGSGWGSGWGSGSTSNWGTSGGSGFSTGSMFGSAGSTGTRSASGFGGTKRR